MFIGWTLSSTLTFSWIGVSTNVTVGVAKTFEACGGVESK
jgi:hypothetical protein